MRIPRRLLVLAAVLSVTVCAGAARAQTVLAKGALPGSTVELVQKDVKTATATAGPDGVAKLQGNLTAKSADVDARIYVDICGELRRVLFVERNQDPPEPGEGCVRREVSGYFLVRRVTELVVDVAAQPPTAWLRQGATPKAWLGKEQPSVASSWRLLPKGFVPYGGGGVVIDMDAAKPACGTTTSCAGSNTKAAVNVGASYWFTRYAAVDASFLRPANINLTGSGTNYNFTSTFDVYAFTIGGQGGVPIGPIRVYGKGGANYHRSSTTTVQTNNDVVLTVNGVQQTIPGGTQTFLMKTTGWSYQFGGGVEGWVAKRIAIYGEAMYMRMKGAAIDGAEGQINYGNSLIFGGVKIHIGK